MASKSKLDDMVTTIQSVVGKLQTILRFTQDHPEQSSSSLQRASLGSLREAQELQTLFFQSNGNDGYEDWDDLEIMSNKLLKKLPIDYLLKIQEENSSGDGWHKTRYDREQKFLKGLNYTGLLNIVLSIRKIESTFSFQSMLWRDKHQIAMELNAPPEQFTYGSSLFELWYCLFEHKAFLRRIHNNNNNNKKGHSKQVVIFGSSQGLLAAYLAMHHVLRNNENENEDDDRCMGECHLDIRGYEVLPSLHKVAVETSLKVELELEMSKSSSSRIKRTAQCRPLLQDMLSADLHECNVLILCSLCWDASTKEGVAKKALREMPKESLVVDFTCDTFDYDIGNSSPSPSATVSNQIEGEIMKDENLSLLLDSALTQVSVSKQANTIICKSNKEKKKKKPKSRRIRIPKLEGFTAGPTSWSDEQALCLYGME